MTSSGSQRNGGLSPDSVGALIELYSEGRFEQLSDRCSVLRRDHPRSAVLFNLMGAARLKLGDDTGALDCFGKAIELDPTYAQAFNNLGSALLEMNRGDEAIGHFNTAISLEPALISAVNNLCAAMITCARFEDAIAAGLRATRLEPDNISANNNLGIAYKHAGKFDEAISCFRTAIRSDENSADSWSNLGSVYLELCQYQNADTALGTAGDIAPGTPDTMTNLAKLFRETGRFDESFKTYSQLLTMNADDPEAHFGCATLQLRKKDFPAGWRGMEHRWRLKDNHAVPPGTAKPLWTGEFVDRLFIWKEQGIGDEVMFASCLPDLASRCGQLTVGVTERLLPLFRRSFSTAIDFIPAHRLTGFDAFDQHAPALTALGHVRQSIGQFQKAARPYLSPEPGHLDRTRKRIGNVAKGRPVAGVSWKTNNAASARKRSMSLEALIRAIPEEYLVVNLQYGDVGSDVEAVSSATGREILCCDQIDIFADLDGFASLVSACDVVVTIDNSTVHFAGALGVPAHVMLPVGADWRWGPNGDQESYWYSSVNMHWQRQPNDWNVPLACLRDALAELTR